MANDNVFEQPLGFGIFLGGFIARSKGLRGMIDNPDDQVIGSGLVFGTRGVLAIDVMSARYS